MKKWLKKFGLVRHIHTKWVSKIPFNFYTKKIEGANNQVKVDAQTIWRSSIHIRGSNNSITINNSRLIRKLHIEVVGDNNDINIGEACQIKDGIIWIEGNNNTCQIGQYTTIESAELYLTEENTKITIGSDCMLADSIIFRTGDSHPILDIHTGSILNPAGDISIGDHVWIGQGVTLLKNSLVAKGAIIGTRSVVNKRFEEEGIVIAGIPAKKVKSGIRWIRERLAGQSAAQSEIPPASGKH